MTLQTFVEVWRTTLHRQHGDRSLRTIMNHHQFCDLLQIRCIGQPPLRLVLFITFIILSLLSFYHHHFIAFIILSLFKFKSFQKKSHYLFFQTYLPLFTLPPPLPTQKEILINFKCIILQLVQIWVVKWGGVIIKIIGQQECKLYLPNLRLLHFMLDKTLTTQVKTNTPQLSD